MKSKKELEEELSKLNTTEKIMDIEDKVKAKRKQLLKRKYNGIKSFIRLFKK